MKKTLSFISIGIIAIVFFAFMFFVLLRRNIPNTIKGTPSPTITLVPIATPLSTQLTVVKVLPEQSQTTPYLPIQKITLTFSDPITPVLLKYEITPKTEVEILQGDPNTLYIVPLTKWTLGANSLTILQATRSTSGKTLFSPYSYSIYIDIPKGPDPNVVLP